MLLRHATPARNLRSIQKQGLLVAKATGKRAAVWVHAGSKSSWAILHVGQRHDVPTEKVVVLELLVPRSWCKKSGKTGLWYCPLDVPADRIRRVVPISEITASPIED